MHDVLRIQRVSQIRNRHAVSHAVPSRRRQSRRFIDHRHVFVRVKHARSNRLHQRLARPVAIPRAPRRVAVTIRVFIAVLSPRPSLARDRHREKLARRQRPRPSRAPQRPRVALDALPERPAPDSDDARAKQLIVTQIAREIQMKSLQLRREQLGYYALTEATPPGQNEPIGSIDAPIDAHFMIEPIALISDFFMDQLETNAQQGS